MAVNSERVSRGLTLSGRRLVELGCCLLPLGPGATCTSPARLTPPTETGGPQATLGAAGQPTGLLPGPPRPGIELYRVIHP